MPKRKRNHHEVQDNSRERQVIELFAPDLQERDGPDRHPKAPPDARHEPTGEPVEIKSTTKEDKSVSTAHGFTRNHLQRMSTRHLIIVDGVNLEAEFLIQRVFYAYPPVHLQSWLLKYTAEFDEHERDIEYMLERSDFDAVKKQRLRRRLQLSLNDPPIPWSMVQQCEEIYGDYTNQLRRLIAHYPPLIGAGSWVTPRSLDGGLFSFS